MTYALLVVLAVPKVTLSATTAKPGDPVVVTVEGEKPKAGKAGATPLVFFRGRDGWQAVFAVPLEEPPPEVAVTVEGAPPEKLVVTPTEFPQESVDVPPELAEPPPDKRPQVDRDNGAIVEALRNDAPPLFRDGFKMPAAGKRNSNFGTWRAYPGGYHSRHLGLDLAARKGAPVRSIAAGKVMLVLDGYLTGGTVVVVHGAGIGSTYFHLSEIAVKKGDEVERGAILGKVGMTGRATGPHIHLGVRVPGGFVDPAAFFRLRLLPGAEAATH